MAIEVLSMQQLRDTFLDFFEQRGHKILASAPLVLHDDSTSLFTSAGMQPYIDAFKGEQEPPANRAASIQKCLRTGDIQDVGHYNRYHTMFEMLGNFSFGDYFKKEAIEFAWDFTTEVMNIPEEILWISVFEDDDEAEQLWHEHIGVPMDRIYRLGREENWWPKVRWQGPCGPCTEIHADLGPDVGCDEHCKFGCDCNRWLELWNLVFQQYTEAEDGTLTPLPQPGIDTGMGLERLAVLSQNKEWSMETDELYSILTAAVEVINEDRDTPCSYGDDDQTDLALRVIADHIRGAAFVMSENVTPSNEGAGYVVRRLIRRAYRFGRKLKAAGPFLYRALPTVGHAMGQAYPRLLEREDYLVEVMRGEEERFDETLERGLALFDELVEDLKKENKTVISGGQAFRLHDTCGFPIEVQREMAAERGMTIDEDGFAKALQQQREQARGSAVGLELADAAAAAGDATTKFVGYDSLSATANIQVIIQDGEATDELAEGQDGGIVLDVTPYYAERGGQAGDTGTITAKNVEFEVTDTVPSGEAIVHFGHLKTGTLSVGDEVTATVNAQHRDDIRRNHTATHLLQAALRRTLGDHVQQSGSLVAPDRLRFDFTHHQAVTNDELRRIENLVNQWIMEDHRVQVEHKSFDEAKQAGAIALFGEQYDETVRTINIGDVSMELCGGTHCHSTGEIGVLFAVDESSVAAGIRRIEAVAGRAAIDHHRSLDASLDEIADTLGCRRQEITDRIDALQQEISDLEDQLQRAREMSAATNLEDMIDAAREVNGANLVATSVPKANVDALATLADRIVNELDRAVVVIGSAGDQKVVFVSKIADELVEHGAHAGKLVGEIAKVCGGGGGGNPTFARAGGSQPDRLDEALQKAPDLLAQQLK